MKTVTLKHNNIEEAEVAVTSIMISLKQLLTDSYLAFYDLVMLARDDNTSIWIPSAIILKKFGLLDESLQMHDTIRNVILSAVEGENTEMILVNPILKGNGS